MPTKSITVTMMAGIPGSGKTTWAKDLIDDNTVYISSDEIRKEFGDVNDMSNNKKVFDTLRERYITALRNCQNVILDATHAKKKYRKEYIDIANENGAEISCVYMDIDYEVAQERNAKRERQVPNDVIRKMFYEFETPTVDEGFKFVIAIDKNGGTTHLF